MSLGIMPVWTKLYRPFFKSPSVIGGISENGLFLIFFGRILGIPSFPGLTKLVADKLYVFRFFSILF